MSYKCRFCSRTFSTRSAYSQHIDHCIPDPSSSEESDFTNDIRDMSLNDQNIEINESDRDFLNYSDQSMSISEGGNQSMSISEGGDQSMSISEKSFNEGSVFEDILLEDDLEESESEVNADYPNKAYGDLMALVTKNKLNNKA